MYKIRSEWAIREIDLPPDLLKSKKALIRWIALSLGVIQPNDGREGALYVLEALFEHVFGRNERPSFEEIKTYVSRRYLEKGKKPPSDESLRHHLRRMIRMGLIERESGRYSFATDILRPDDPTAFVDVLFERMERARKAIKRAISDLSSLYNL